MEQVYTVHVRNYSKVPIRRTDSITRIVLRVLKFVWWKKMKCRRDFFIMRKKSLGDNMLAVTLIIPVRKIET